MDLYQLNEQHHRDRASYWLQQGRPDYAQGSLRKAAKWNAKRREFDYAMNGAYPQTEIEALMGDWMRMAEKKYADAFVMALYGEGD